MQRYTKLFCDGQAYLSNLTLRASTSGEEITGPAIRQLARYETSGLTPEEVLLLKMELEEYRATGFTPEQLINIFKGLPHLPKRECTGQIRLKKR